MVGYCERAYDLTSWMVALFTLAYRLFRCGEHHATAQLICVVDNMTELTGYSPEKMDIIELARFGSTMRTEIDTAVLTEVWANEIRELITEWAGPTDVLDRVRFQMLLVSRLSVFTVRSIPA